MLSKVRILRFVDGEGYSELEDLVAVESILNIHINNKPYITLFLTPVMIEELVIGNLYTSGIVKSISDINSIKISGESVYVDVRGNVETRYKGVKPSSCMDDVLNLTIEYKVCSFNFRVKPKNILEASRLMHSKAVIFKQTGCTHCAAIFNENLEILALAEDIGRHNAIDKVIGYMIKNLLPTEKSILTVSGRLTYEVVLKAAIAKIPIVASISAPSKAGINLASKIGITLVGFTRGRRFNIYTYPERIIQ
ncbi:MAG: formate dehydrogenase accessory sulfurtransferase FdhD [Candidatus Methanomethylicia archaeon]